MNTISLKDCKELRGRRPGLILGPAATAHPGIIEDIANRLGVANTPELPWPDDLVDENKTAAIAQKMFREVGSGIGIEQLAKVHWSCVLSVSPDRNFEEALIAANTERVIRPDVDVLDDDLRRTPVVRSLPVYKLLGSFTAGNYNFIESLYALNKANWPLPVRSFRDAVKTNPVLCLGMEECPTILRDLFSALLAGASIPSPLLFLASDPLTSNKALGRILERATTAYAVDATVGELGRAFGQKRVVRPNTDTNVKWPNISISAFSHMVTVVNQWTNAEVRETDKNRHLDLLFSPNADTWEPFVANLDLRRDLMTDLITEINSYFDTRTSDSAALVLTGAAASGKTTLLKRIAFEVASAGEVVLWLKPTVFGDNAKLVRELFTAIAKTAPKDAKLMVVMDDPLSFGALTTRQVMVAAERAGIDLLLVVSLRASEWDPKDTAATTGTLPLLMQCALMDSLSDSEWKSLTAKLVEYEIAANTLEAEQRIMAAESQHTRDTLAILYTLIPHSRSIIREAVRTEHLRLGKPETLAAIIEGLAAESPAPLQTAYDYVAVARIYNVSLPLEVIVSALGIEYSRWTAETAGRSPAWGILYPIEVNDDQDGVYYTTRNSIVAESVLQLLNGGGSLTRSGEVRVLKALLAACTGSQIFYREFCVQILRSKALYERLNFEDGLQLFDTAIDALPYEDKTLLHHKGRWLRKRGKDPAMAKKVLLDAVSASDYPNASRSEPNAHIFTSLASNAVSAVRRGVISPEEGVSEVFGFLSQAHAVGRFDPHYVHVQARAVWQLLKRTNVNADTIGLANMTLRALDDTLFSLRAYTKNSSLRMSDNQALTEIKQKLLTTVASRLENTEAFAEELWTTHQIQDGFVFEVLQRLNAARREGSGTSFNRAYDYAANCLARVEAATVAPVPQLVRATLSLLYEWRVDGVVPGKAELKEVWPKLEGLARRAMKGVATKSDPSSAFILAVALCHSDKWSQARTIFQQIRDAGLPNTFVFAPRTWLRDPRGLPRRVQGTIRSSVRERTLSCRSPPTDFKLSKQDKWPADRHTAHAFVTIAYGGPTATTHSS